MSDSEKHTSKCPNCGGVLIHTHGGLGVEYHDCKGGKCTCYVKSDDLLCPYHDKPEANPETALTTAEALQDMLGSASSKITKLETERDELRALVRDLSESAQEACELYYDSIHGIPWYRVAQERIAAAKKILEATYG